MSNKVIMQFSGHDIEGDAATLADMNSKLTQRDALLNALQEIRCYPLTVEGFNNVSAVLLRFAAVKAIARAAIVAAGEQL